MSYDQWASDLADHLNKKSRYVAPKTKNPLYPRLARNTIIFKVPGDINDHVHVEQYIIAVDATSFMHDTRSGQIDVSFINWTAGRKQLAVRGHYGRYPIDISKLQMQGYKLDLIAGELSFEKAVWSKVYNLMTSSHQHMQYLLTKPTIDIEAVSKNFRKV